MQMKIVVIYQDNFYLLHILHAIFLATLTEMTLIKNGFDAECLCCATWVVIPLRSIENYLFLKRLISSSRVVANKQLLPLLSNIFTAFKVGLKV